MCVSDIKGFLGHFYASVPSFGKPDVYKEIGYLENVARFAFGDSDVGNNIKSMLPLPLLVTQAGEWCSKVSALYSAEQKYIDRLVSFSAVISLTVKVAVVAEQVFRVVIFSSYGVVQDLVKDTAEMFSNGYSIYSISREISTSGNSMRCEERAQKEALRALNVSAFCLASLDLVSKTCMQVSGAKYIVLTGTTVIQVSKHVMGYYASKDYANVKAK